MLRARLPASMRPRRMVIVICVHRHRTTDHGVRCAIHATPSVRSPVPRAHSRLGSLTRRTGYSASGRLPSSVSGGGRGLTARVSTGKRGCPLRATWTVREPSGAFGNVPVSPRQSISRREWTRGTSPRVTARASQLHRDTLLFDGTVRWIAGARPTVACDRDGDGGRQRAAPPPSRRR